jgi:hypothetical protein
VRIGAREAARVLLFVLPVTAGRTSAAAPADEDHRIDPVEVTLVAGSLRCPPLLRDVVAEQLADVTPHLFWVCRERIDAEDPFRSDDAGAGAIRIAIDVRAGAEARLTLGDTRSDRFVVRRVPLRNGLDELGREQIGQIVRFATLALRDGSSATLSRNEARAAVATWPAPLKREAAPPAVDRAPPRPELAIDVGPIWSVSMFSPQTSLVQELAIAAVIGRPTSHVWPWIDAGYRLPASDEAQPVGVELSAVSLRAGLAAGQARTRSLSFSGGAGVVLDRVRFAPIGAAASVAPAAPDAFWTVGARVMISGEWRATAHLTVGARLACDIASADVHYDLRSSDGSARRVLTAYRVAPGVGVAVAWRL